MYKIYDFPQRSQLWFKLREGRLTFSNLGTALGNPKFETVEALGYRLRNNVEQTFSILAKDRMRRGTEMENEIRERYQKKYPDRKVTEVGFVVPVGTPWKGWKEEWNNHVGASPDGLINSDGIIEIKCSDKMPKWITEDSDIYPNYYAQIQGNMAFLHREWCDLLVHVYGDGTYEIRVDFDQEYWERCVPKIGEFIEKYLIS